MEQNSKCQVCKLDIASYGGVWVHVDFEDDHNHDPIPELTDAEEKRLLKLINGALKDTINNHGPITKDYISSASKRIYGNMKHHVAHTFIQKESNQDST